MAYTGPERREEPHVICKQETEIALLVRQGEATNKLLEKLVKLLEGNGSIGIVTQTELNKQSLARLWWFVGAVALVVAGSSIKALLF